MKKISGILLLALLMTVSSFAQENPKDPPVYTVKKLKRPMKIDADWNKREWKKIKELSITNYMGTIPSFKPVTKAKMMYDNENVYVIFKVEDRFIRLQTAKFGGKVFEDACVEFFFSPDSSQPLKYFNFETNAGGMALMHYQMAGDKPTILTDEDFKSIEIAHSLPERLDQEITEPTTWTLEYRLPLALLKKYSNVTQPKKGVAWRANFFKTASKNSNPHYITWSFIDNPRPAFHLPKFFGTLKFK